MDKCWFVLRQTHYPPPTVETLPSGEIQQRGFICIGHLIESPTTLDDESPLNDGDPMPYPLDMLMNTSRPINIRWRYDAQRGYELSGSVDAPIAAATGISVGADLNGALRDSVEKYWEIEALEVTIARPTQGYMKSSTAAAKVPKTLAGKEAYMITGLIIARGKKSGRVASESSASGGGGLNFSAQGIAGARAKMGANRGEKSSLSAEYAEDFVWAVRLAKLSKGWLDSRWSKETVHAGAAFGQGEPEEPVPDILADEGIGPEQIVGGGEAAGFFVLPKAQKQPTAS